MDKELIKKQICELIDSNDVTNFSVSVEVSTMTSVNGWQECEPTGRKTIMVEIRTTKAIEKKDEDACMCKDCAHCVPGYSVSGYICTRPKYND